MRVLVTGGAGFIGSHLADALAKRGDLPIVVDNLSTGKKENLPAAAVFHCADIRDAAALERAFELERPEVVSHHAAQTDVRRSMLDPSFDAQVNIVGSLHLLELCVKYKVKKILFASSSSIYPELQSGPFSETDPVRPLSAYGLTKLVGEKYLEFYRDVYGVRFTTFRYGNVYGPRQDPKGESGVVAIFCGQMLGGVRPTLFGDGRKTRDYVYVDDIVSANLKAMDGAGDGEVFNLGWGREISDFEVFDAVRKSVGVQVEPKYQPKRPGEPARIALACGKARARLGWTPQVPFEEGIARSVRSYRLTVSTK